MGIKLLVGLQNPGATYEHTRHNVGGWLINAWVSHLNGNFKLDKKIPGEIANLPGQDLCIALLPLTFMNHSGLAVKALSHYYRINPSEMVIAHDDLDLPAGRIKLKTGGGHGGHNGLRDTIRQLGNSDFHRLRIGIGHPGHKTQVVNYVLNKPTLVDQQLILTAIKKSMQIIPMLIAGDIAKAMNLLNTQEK